eukprot:TRINITY_DN1309_c1_g1_i2.p1 TRINITY_DN1309_c1_g1~~TRINITY_DN1309_c1_g1_i2.p1  ORF type:complete len:821 (+),score=146.91 TRINITY_DN1309_c1_g1_i2:444-2906(+)
MVSLFVSAAPFNFGDVNYNDPLSSKLGVLSLGQLVQLVSGQRADFAPAAAVEIGRRAFEVHNCETLYSEGGITSLVDLLYSDDVNTTLCALQALINVTIHEQTRGDVAEAGGVGRLIEYMQSPVYEIQSHALWCMTNMSSDVPSCETLRIDGGLIPLVSLLKVDDEGLRLQSLQLLSNVLLHSESFETHRAICELGGIVPLLRILLVCQNRDALMYCLHVLQRLSMDEQTVARFCACKGTKVVSKFLSMSFRNDLVIMSLKLVAQLAHTSELARRDFLDMDCMPAFVEYTRHNIDAVVVCGLDVLTGMLSDDHTRGVFYEQGGLREAVRLLSHNGEAVVCCAADTVAAACAGNLLFCRAAAHMNVMRPLVIMCASLDLKHHIPAVRALAVLTMEEHACAVFVQEQGPARLMPLFSSPDVAVCHNAMRVAQNLTAYDVGIQALYQMDIVGYSLAVLASCPEDPVGQTLAIGVVRSMMTNEDIRRTIVKSGVLPIVYEMSEDTLASTDNEVERREAANALLIQFDEVEYLPRDVLHMRQQEETLNQRDRVGSSALLEETMGDLANLLGDLGDDIPAEEEREEVARQPNLFEKTLSDLDTLTSGIQLDDTETEGGKGQRAGTVDGVEGRLAVKCRYNGDVRMLRVATSVDVEELTRSICAKYQLQAPSTQLRFLDDSDDSVLLESDDDLLMAIETMREKGQKRLEITVISIAPSPRGASSSAPAPPPPPVEMIKPTPVPKKYLAKANPATNGLMAQLREGKPLRSSENSEATFKRREKRRAPVQRSAADRLIGDLMSAVATRRASIVPPALKRDNSNTGDGWD